MIRSGKVVIFGMFIDGSYACAYARSDKSYFVGRVSAEDLVSKSIDCILTNEGSVHFKNLDGALSDMGLAFLLMSQGSLMVIDDSVFLSEVEDRVEVKDHLTGEDAPDTVTIKIVVNEVQGILARDLLTDGEYGTYSIDDERLCALSKTAELYLTLDFPLTGVACD